MERFKVFYEDATFLINNFDKLPDLSQDEVSQHLKTRNFDDETKQRMLRDDFVRKFSWSLPCKEAIDAIRKWSRPPIYDLMAGSGYWSKILNDRGIKTIATDVNVGERYNSYKHKMHSKVRRKNAYKVAGSTIPRSKAGYGDVLLAWPPYNEPVGNTIIKLIPVGSRVFYFGEGFHGCTGDDEMHCRLNNDFKELDYVSLPTWSGIHDNLLIYEKITDDYNHPDNYNPYNFD